MVPRVRVLNDQELSEIDRASRELLEDVGVSVHHEEALEVYRRAGAKVDFNRQRVRLPSYLIDDALSKCSPSIRLYGRNGASPLTVGGMRSYFGTVGFATNVLDMETGVHRAVLSPDLEDMFRLADVLDPPEFILTPATPKDVPTEVSDLYEFKIGLTHTRKHIIAQAKGKENLNRIIAMAEEVGGSLEALQERPFFSVLVCLTSPLTLRPDAAELIIEGARAGLPLFIEAGPMCGGTAPATLAATLICANAELLNSFVLAKAVNPGVPLVYASWARIMDMRSAAVSHGGPEFGLLRVGTTQLARFYRLPSGGGGILADSKSIDAQLGMEKIGTALLPALAGTNMILGMGILAEENTVSLESLMLDHEVAGYVRRVVAGILVDDETTDLSIFREVGPGGNFLDRDHTMEHFREEMWIPEITDRGSVVRGEDPEFTGMRKRAREALKKALGSYVPPPLPKGVESRLEAIIGG
ncbi:MAG: trimethylamine methyltransferase family protein [Deltaproteobacteria bacterium]|nr:trimethylamine methyltransferase family protein [Deltaproteobacteria bacterium]